MVHPRDLVQAASGTAYRASRWVSTDSALLSTPNVSCSLARSACTICLLKTEVTCWHASVLCCLEKTDHLTAEPWSLIDRQQLSNKLNVEVDIAQEKQAAKARKALKEQVERARRKLATKQKPKGVPAKPPPSMALRTVGEVREVLAHAPSSQLSSRVPQVVVCCNAGHLKAAANLSIQHSTTFVIAYHCVCSEHHCVYSM